MIELTLQAIPNQILSIQLENNSYQIEIRTIDINNKMAISIYRNQEIVIQGLELLGNIGIIPFRYLENGNFVMTTMDDELPDYTKFGITQFLNYVTVAELAAARA